MPSEVFEVHRRAIKLPPIDFTVKNLLNVSVARISQNARIHILNHCIRALNDLQKVAAPMQQHPCDSHVRIVLSALPSQRCKLLLRHRYRSGAEENNQAHGGMLAQLWLAYNKMFSRIGPA